VRRVGDVTKEWTNRVSEVTWDVPVEVVTIKWGDRVEGLLRVKKVGIMGKVVVKEKDEEKGIWKGLLAG
jgi:hypothetical protein